MKMLSRIHRSRQVVLLPFFYCTLLHAAEPVPERCAKFLSTYCLDCHDAATAEGEVNLEYSEIAWDTDSARHHWERVLKAVKTGAMPPQDMAQPDSAEHTAMLQWLDESLTRHSPTGGTVLRRLNRDEYRYTIRQLFGMPFELPDGFPRDTSGQQFDTIGDRLILSPPLMNAYADVASSIADEIFPPVRPAPVSTVRMVTPDDLVISYSSGSVRSNAMRLASRCGPKMRSCTWPSKVELTDSGLYRIQIDASTFGPASAEPMLLKVLASDVSGKDSVNVNSLRLLQQIEVSEQQATTVEFEAELYEGQTVVFHYANAPLNSDRADKESLLAWFRSKFEADPRYLAAWQQLTQDDSRGGFRGGLGWKRVKNFMASDELDIRQATMDSEATKKLLKAIAGNPVLYTETIAYDSFENGPALEIHDVLIEGPLSRVDGPRDTTRRKIRSGILGSNFSPDSDQQIRQMLTRFLSRVFRRPVQPELVDGFQAMLQQHQATGHGFEQCMHLVLRAALMSPRFLYRETTEGLLDEYDLASRLAYFLTSHPPDDKLLALAEKGKLSDTRILRVQAVRLMPRDQAAPMIRRFTGQWLDTNRLDDIMPDPRLNFTDEDQRRSRQEVEMFFAEMVKKNLPMTDFVSPDFTFTTAGIARKIYQLNDDAYDPKNKSMQRVTLPRDGRYGGILGQAAVLMATANGVDTQPVVRGVWVLENVLGDPPPPPPKAVPAITPDTAGARTPRDLLAAHATEDSCTSCHRKIDAIGFALENFDAVGRWRDHYPVWSKDSKGRPVSRAGATIDSSGRLPDGTSIANIVDLKRWVTNNVDQFSQCLAEKLITYATGREPSYVERKEISGIVEQNHETGNGFQDLILALVLSETFHTK
ncbi:MAG: DUF1588 domain-containing protein [Fuerstiella sp.]|nr:DUF1588 domain-containing protein [Fuerstiella sp.]